MHAHTTWSPEAQSLSSQDLHWMVSLANPARHMRARF